jgi:hypothetical protein
MANQSVPKLNEMKLFLHASFRHEYSTVDITEGEGGGHESSPQMEVPLHTPNKLPITLGLTQEEVSNENRKHPTAREEDVELGRKGTLIGFFVKSPESNKIVEQ